MRSENNEPTVQLKVQELCGGTGDERQDDSGMWQILVKWNETTDEYINMVVRGPLKTKEPVRRFHVTVNSQTGELCRNSDAKRLSRFEKAVLLALNTANEVSEAKRLLKSN